MYWHVQHDDHVFSGDQLMLLANDESQAQRIVDLHNAEIDRLAAELRRFHGEVSLPIVGDQMPSLLTHLEAFIKRERRGNADLQNALDCLTSYLLDTTEEVFEEDPEIDDARSAIQDRIAQHEENT